MTPRAPFLPKKRNIISKHTGTSRLSPSHLVELTLSFLTVPPWPPLRLGRVVRSTLQGAEVLGSNPPPCGLVRSLTSQFVFSTRVSISSHSCLPQRSKEICVRAFARLKWGLCAFYALEVVFLLRTPRTVARCAAR